jgi:hypothetical protein
MAHFCLLVTTRGPEDVADALRPFFDDDNEDRRQPHFVFVEDRHADRDPQSGRRGYWKNPIGKWDGWVIGGRWQGLLSLTQGSTGDEAGNRCRMNDLEALLRAAPDRLAEVHALLVDGVWRDADEPRFAVRGAWQAEIRRTAAGLADDDWVTVIDCHC